MPNMLLPLALMLPTPAAPAEPASLCPAALTRIDESVSKTMAQGSPGMIVAVASQGRPLLL